MHSEEFALPHSLSFCISSWPMAAVRETAAQLRGRGFVVIDNFLTSTHGCQLRDGVLGLNMQPWNLGDGACATSTKAIRGDLVAYPSMEAITPFGIALREWLYKLDWLVEALGKMLTQPGELARVVSREAPMATCYPPGTSIIRHYDNNCDGGSVGDCNGRRLTSIYYL